MMRRVWGTALVLLATTTAAGCATAVAGKPVAAVSATGQDRSLITKYFADLDDAGTQGAGAQRDFLRRTQHPDFASATCDLGGLTLRIEPTMSTLRTDPKWKPERAGKPPRGTVYVVAVSVWIRRDTATLAEQIGSQRVVVLDGKAYGFTPCPTR
ncbi:hypothetical protein [Actinokineospora inagensis]|uniref:hypothetical protein n=1 Tax=Actinokineospora inagensis TaxID=103730 RepID=UPI0003FB76E2|nr:hypothetical protein [Actinokineospora inagensis]